MPAPTVFALLDGNNFYASCERVFDPKLIGSAATQPGRRCAPIWRGVTEPGSTLRSRPDEPQAKRRGGPNRHETVAHAPDPDQPARHRLGSAPSPPTQLFVGLSRGYRPFQGPGAV